MSERSRSLAEGAYSWKAIAGTTLALYASLLDKNYGR
jgi:hypothetical protein